MEYSNTAIDIIDCFVLFAFRNLLSSITTISMISKQIWRHSIEDNKKEQKIPYHKNLSTYKRKGSNLWIRKKVERIFFQRTCGYFFIFDWMMTKFIVVGWWYRCGQLKITWELWIYQYEAWNMWEFCGYKVEQWKNIADMVVCWILDEKKFITHNHGTKRYTTKTTHDSNINSFLELENPP